MLPPLRRSVRVVLALALGAAVVLFTVLWMAATYRVASPVELGFDADYHAASRALVVRAVTPQSPAERAGMRPGDRIVAIDGAPLESAESQPDAWRRHRPGDTIRLTIERPGVAGRMILVGTFRSTRPGSTTEYVTTGLRNLFPIPFVIVGLAVLFLRQDDAHAWLLALLFASFVTIPGFPRDFLGVPSAFRPFARAYEAVFLGLVTLLIARAGREGAMSDEQ